VDECEPLAEGGSLVDQKSLGRMYALGENLVQKINLKQAFYWTQKAAAQGRAVQNGIHVTLVDSSRLHR